MDTIHHDKCIVCGSNDIQEKHSLKDHSHTGDHFTVSKCKNCGFHFTQNAPDSNSIGPYYKSENYVSHSDTQKGLFFKVYHAVRDYMLKKKRNLVNSVTGLKTGKLLDIGTGTGYFPNIMIQSGWKVEGVEQDEETRNYAASKFNFTIHDTPALYDLPKESFDAITMWHVLEHVHDLDGYLKKIYSILKDKGAFVVAVPNHTSFDQEHYKEFWAAWDIPIHLWHFNPATMSKLIERYGFKVEKIVPMPFDAAYVSMLSEEYKTGSKLPGLLKGIRFALKGKSKPEKCSSVIYVLKKV
ncbi:MAG: methyltransferase type 12 [Flavobacteriales bacterium]|nr:methyltransferase type 12 [Flavobacteriales bacterium]|tara:strand:+ start:6364 stop:7254 length:891 start_codon:yes stop_codon:yes gene_type:complete